MKALGFKLAFTTTNASIIGSQGSKIGFYTAYVGPTVTWSRTTFSTTSESVKGTTLSSIHINESNRILGLAASRAAINAQKIASQTITDSAIAKNTRQKIKSASKESLIALVDEGGEAYEYRVILNDANKAEHMGMDNRIDEVLGTMYGGITDKIESRKINKMVIENVYDDYEANYEKEKDKFIRVGPRGAYEDVWAVIPTASKEHIEVLFGKREMFIRVELVDLVMGYRKFHAADTANLKKLPKKINHWVDIGEKIWKEVVAYGAVQIVIKTPIVLIDNITSNIIILIRDGMNPATVVRRHQEGMQALSEYKDSAFAVQDIRYKLKADPTNNKLKVELGRHLDDIQNNPVRVLIEAGIFQSITEDINVDKFTSASAFEQTKIGKAVSTNMPAFLKPIVRNAFMTKDTWMFHNLMKATQYSDFLARYSKYVHLMEKGNVNGLNGAEFDKAHDEILNDIIEDFVNYDVPQSKALQYLNDMGLVRFTKYYLRTQRIIAKKWKQQPLNNLISVGMQHYVGDVSDINDSWILSNDPISKLNDPLGLIGDAVEPKGLTLLVDLLFPD